MTDNWYDDVDDNVRPIDDDGQVPAPEYCGVCDGCGWVEGGKTLRTQCWECGGSGVITAKKSGSRE